MSGLEVVHPVYNALPDLPGRCNLCTHNLSTLFGYYFGELYLYSRCTKMPFLKIAVHGVMNFCERSLSRTPGVQYATGLPR